MKRSEMSKADLDFVRRENGSLWQFFRAFFLSKLYAVIGFFAYWSLKDGVIFLSLAMMHRVAGSNPARLISYVTVAVGGVGWFVTYLILMLTLERTEGARQIFKKLGIWCAAAGLAWLLGEGLIWLALRIA